MKIERLCNKAARASCDGGFLNKMRQIGGKHDDLGVGVMFPYFQDKIEPAAIRQVIIEQEQMDAGFAEGESGILQGVGDKDIVLRFKR